MVDLSLLQDFITEALEHLEELESSLLKLEQDMDHRETLDDIFRSIHTIKGAAQFTGLTRTSELSHKLENLLALLRQGDRELTQEVTDTLIDTKDRLTQLTNELEQFQEERSEVDDLLTRINALTESQQEDKGTAARIAVEEATGSDQEELARKLESALDLSVLDDETPPAEEALSAGEPASSQSAPFLSAGQGEQRAPRPEPIADTAIVGEISGESYDVELSKIFLQQAEKKSAQIREILRELPTAADKDGLLAQAAASLQNMKSAANYMGYSHFTHFFENWLTQIAAARQATSADSEASLTSMSAYAEQLERILQQSSVPDALPQGAEWQPEESAGAQEPTNVASLATIDEGLIRQEVADEAYDEELFAIFIDQLSANLSAIRRQLEECKTSEDKPDLLERCAGNLAAMKSSANYMGYGNLLRFYENWQRAIQAARLESTRNEEVDLAPLLAAVERLVNIIPQADAYQQAEVPAVPHGASAGTAGDESVFPAALAEELPSPPAPTSPEDTEGALFDTLSSSVDAAIGVDRADVSALHGVLVQMLGGNDEEAAPAAATTGMSASKAEPEKTAKPVPSPSVDENAPTEMAGQGELSAESVQAAPEEKPERRRHERRIGERRQAEAPGPSIYKHSIRVDSAKIDSLMNQVGELVVSKAYFAQILTDLRNLQQELKDIGLDQRGQKPIRELSFKLSEATVSLSRVSNELQEGVMKVRMLPVSQLFNRYPRLVRDLVRKTEKKVDLVIKGEETELDKMVIEEISDPLIHIIRNAVDHGIESPLERKKAGKPEISTLTLEAYHESNHIVIEVTDDGRGINVERIKDKALEKGLVSEQELERMSDAEAKRFIMMPGFSTAEIATETSGRGVGMDVIKTNIEKLNGTVEVDSQVGVYTRIRIKIPLTLAIIQALLIRVGTEIYTIPLSVVEETLRIYEHETSVIEGIEVIHLRDTTMPIFKLSDLFNLGSTRSDISKSFVVIVTTGMQKIGLVVDELMGQEEVVIKPLVDYLREESGFSGATIIGDGRISLILDIYELVKLTGERQASRYKKFAAFSKLKRGQIAEGVGHEHVAAP